MAARNTFEDGEQCRGEHGPRHKVPARFDELVSRAKGLKYRFPTRDNRLEAVRTEPGVPQELVDCAERTRPIVHPRHFELAGAFLRHKQSHGSTVERAVYAGLDIEGFFRRLLTRRPLMFMTERDLYFLRDGTSGDGVSRPPRFEDIGTEAQTGPLLLEDFQSYEEMEVSALLGVSVPTRFINSGGRNNVGMAARSGSFEPRGVYVALVGCRFERPGLMEWKHMMVTRKQNTPANGYGKSGVSGNPMLRAWAALYGLEHLPSHDEAEADRRQGGQRFIELPHVGGMFDTEVYRARCELTAEAFLAEADDRAARGGAVAFCHIVGLGLGVWQVDSRQEQIQADAYAAALRRLSLRHVGEIHFSWFGRCSACGGVASGGDLQTASGHSVRVVFDRRDPAETLPAPPTGARPWLLVAQYAWDSNSYPGNEYWTNDLCASGDPAAACCSFIPELQNPDVNIEAFSGKVTLVPGPTPAYEVLRNSVQGIFVGAALGDAMGVRTEFLSRDEAEAVCKDGPLPDLRNWSRERGPDGSLPHYAVWEEGDWTDDTDQHIICMLSLTAGRGRVDQADIARRLLRWMDHGLDFAPFHDTKSHGAGNTMRMMLSEVGGPFVETGRPELGALLVWAHPFCALGDMQVCSGAANGSVMRCAILGAVGAGATPRRDLRTVATDAANFSRVTHPDPRCAAACAVVCTLVSQLLAWRLVAGDTPAPSLDEAEAMLAKSADLGVEVLQSEAKTLDERMRRLTEGLGALPTRYRDHRQMGPLIEDTWRESRDRVQNQCGPDELRSYVGAKGVEELRLSEAIGYCYKPVGCAALGLRRVCGATAPEGGGGSVPPGFLSQDFCEVINTIMRQGGDADTNATVAAAIIGAVLGRTGLPAAWVESLKAPYGDWVVARVDDFFEAAVSADVKPEPVAPFSPSAPVPTEAVRPAPATMGTAIGDPIDVDVKAAASDQGVDQLMDIGVAQSREQAQEALRRSRGSVESAVGMLLRGEVNVVDQAPPEPAAPTAAHDPGRKEEAMGQPAADDAPAAGKEIKAPADSKVDAAAVDLSATLPEPAAEPAPFAGPEREPAQAAPSPEAIASELVGRAQASGRDGSVWDAILVELRGSPMAAPLQVEGWSLLHEAAAQGHDAAVGTLINHFGADPLARSADGREACTVARDAGHEAVAASLKAWQPLRPLSSKALGYVLASEDSLTAPKLFVLIGGVGRPEPWKGWRQRYYARGQESGVGVVVCNPNYGGGSQFDDHVAAALKEVVQQSAASRVMFAVASAAGQSLLEALAQWSEEQRKRVARIAFLDSAHRLPPKPVAGTWTCAICSAPNADASGSCHLCQSPKPSSLGGVGSPEMRALLQRAGRNWISGEFLSGHCKEVGCALPDPGACAKRTLDVAGLDVRFGCSCSSSGAVEHEQVPFAVEEQVFKFLKETEEVWPMQQLAPELRPEEVKVIETFRKYDLAKTGVFPRSVMQRVLRNIGVPQRELDVAITAFAGDVAQVPYVPFLEKVFSGKR